MPLSAQSLYVYKFYNQSEYTQNYLDNWTAEWRSYSDADADTADFDRSHCGSRSTADHSTTRCWRCPVASDTSACLVYHWDQTDVRRWLVSVPANDQRLNAMSSSEHRSQTTTWTSQTCTVHSTATVSSHHIADNTATRSTDAAEYT